MKEVTIRDIAAKTGCSIASVSRALNHGGKLLPETRKRILSAANEMGYRRSGKQRIIALILPRRNAIAGFYPSALLQRIVKHPLFAPPETILMMLSSEDVCILHQTVFPSTPPRPSHTSSPAPADSPSSASTTPDALSNTPTASAAMKRKASASPSATSSCTDTAASDSFSMKRRSTVRSVSAAKAFCNQPLNSAAQTPPFSSNGPRTAPSTNALHIS